jgi:hypothetical protein
MSCSTLFKETLPWQIALSLVAAIAVLNSIQNSVLFQGTEVVKTAITLGLCLGIDRRKAAPPGLAQRRQFGMAITIAGFGVQFLIHYHGERHCMRSCDRLWQNEVRALFAFVLGRKSGADLNQSQAARRSPRGSGHSMKKGQSSV